MPSISGHGFPLGLILVTFCGTILPRQPRIAGPEWQGHDSTARTAVARKQGQDSQDKMAKIGNKNSSTRTDETVKVSYQGTVLQQKVNAGHRK
jgi:hypothetical protein